MPAWDDRIKQADAILYQCMKEKNKTDITPEECMPVLHENGMYIQKRKDGLPFRTDLRKMRGRYGLPYETEHLRFEQEENKKWRISLKRDNNDEVKESKYNYEKEIKKLKKIHAICDKKEKRILITSIIPSLSWIFIHVFWLKHVSGGELLYRLGLLLEYLVPSLIAASLFYYILSYRQNYKRNKGVLISLYKAPNGKGLQEIMTCYCNIFVVIIKAKGTTLRSPLEFYYQSKYKYRDFYRMYSEEERKRLLTYLNKMNESLEYLRSDRSQLNRSDIQTLVIQISFLVREIKNYEKSKHAFKTSDLYKLYTLYKVLFEWIKYYKIWDMDWTRDKPAESEKTGI